VMKWMRLANFIGLLAIITLVVSLLGCTQAISESEKKAITDAAVSYQTQGQVYSADTYQVVKLKKGDMIYGMLPGQTPFYTDQATVDAGKESYKTLYSLLQIRPHPVYGYRTQLGRYEVLTDMNVASGKCLANKAITIEGKTETLGDGGGFQYVIIEFKDKVKLVDQSELHE
jgi:hypothetical protein